MVNVGPHDCADVAGFLESREEVVHMQTQSSVFDDIAKLMTGAMGMAQGMQQEARSFARAQADRLVAELDLVSRDEFEVVKQMAAEARAEADELKRRLSAMEARLGAAQ